MTSQVLLERGDQLAELQQHAAAAHSGRDGRLVLVGGVAGSGKTSLLNAFRAALPAGVLVLSGGCEPLSAPRPLGPLLDFAPELGHGLVARLAAPLDRHQVFLALLDALRAESGPKVLVLEDLHWADDATLDLIRYCGRRLGGTRTLLLATYRHDETLGAHPLRRVLGDLAGFTAVHRLEVPQLSPAAVAELTEGSALDPVALYERTAGNPFFVTEVLADGGSALPAKVEDAVLARASRLSIAGRTVLDVAAVIGSGQDVQLLERLAEYPAGVEECLEHGMLVGDGLTTTFRHEIAREAILGSLTPSRLRRLHAQVLDALQDEYGADPGDDPGPRRSGAEPYARLAHHAAGAGDAERTVEYALAAGR